MEWINDKSISSQTRRILLENNIILKKSLGQNFLTDGYVLQKIVDEAELSSTSGVIEIGPGIGSLTEQLGEVAGKVVAIEIDRHLVDVLVELFQNHSKIRIIHGDILKVNIKKLIDEFFQEVTDIHVVANLPYYITSPIIIHLLEGGYPLQNIVIMIQKEVAQRLVAGPGTKDYGSFSIFVQYFAKIKEVAHIPAHVFIPRPKVDSSVVVLTLREKPPVKVSNERLFFDVVRASFAQRRKTLLNTLQAKFPQLGKDIIKSCLIRSNIDPIRRGESLSIDEFAKLSEEIGYEVKRL